MVSTLFDPLLLGRGPVARVRQSYALRRYHEGVFDSRQTEEHGRASSLVIVSTTDLTVG
jgi:hypothetical protein